MSMSIECILDLLQVTNFGLIRIFFTKKNPRFPSYFPTKISFLLRSKYFQGFLTISEDFDLRSTILVTPDL